MTPRTSARRRATADPGILVVGIEVNNESGTDVDEAAIAALSRFVLDGTRVGSIHKSADLETR